MDVFFYPEEERIARAALVYAEQSYDTLSRRFGHDVPERIPLIVYASHVDFEQTNVLPFVPPEGVLGVTEFMKRRVALPFRGSYSEFRHTLRHELVHVFELSILAREAALHPRARAAPIPLWWSEGLAEFFSAEQDSRDEMVVRDLVLAGRLPTLNELGPVMSPIVYAIGGDAHRFLASRFGAWRVRPRLRGAVEVLVVWRRARACVRPRPRRCCPPNGSTSCSAGTFPTSVRASRCRWPRTRLAPLALKPVALGNADTTQVAYLSPRSGYTNIYVQSLDARRAPARRRRGRAVARVRVVTPVLLAHRRARRRAALRIPLRRTRRGRVLGHRAGAHRGRYRFDGLTSHSEPRSGRPTATASPSAR